MHLPAWQSCVRLGAVAVLVGTLLAPTLAVKADVPSTPCTPIFGAGALGDQFGTGTCAEQTILVPDRD